jgi:hypothetical protein
MFDPYTWRDWPFGHMDVIFSLILSSPSFSLPNPKTQKKCVNRDFSLFHFATSFTIHNLNPNRTFSLKRFTISLFICTFSQSQTLRHLGFLISSRMQLLKLNFSIAVTTHTIFVEFNSQSQSQLINGSS